MSSHVRAESVVRLTPESVEIDGESVILLCASLFYFRIPRELWKERMLQLKAMGYNCIDVYFPWNYHEPREGEWDFTGMHDAEAFLRIAAESGLWVVARPGPYICSEWDGGGLPAYLLAKEPEIKLREYDPGFLEQVAKWYGVILPILRRHQAGEGGSVILVQLDNELDFYGCGDPEAYMSVLRDMAVAHGIKVPLIACAGQGGIVQATGLAQGVIPTCNFYPDDRDPEFEAKVLHYRAALSDLGLPLMVTETNRSHYLLRRLLSAGAKLLGPYLQVSGTNFGFTNATNNWGRPLAFLASDYDFGGMISPEGHIRREGYEGRLLARLLQSYGPALAAAAVDPHRLWSGEGDMREVFGPFGLRLKGGGSLLFLSNGAEEARSFALRAQDGRSIPTAGTLTLTSLGSLILPVDVPLSLWGVDGKVIYATAELYWAKLQDGGTVLAFHQAADGGEIALDLCDVVEFEANAAAVILENDRFMIQRTGAETACIRFRLKGGRQLTVVISDRLKALYAESVSLNGELTVTEPDFREERLHDEGAGVSWKRSLAKQGEPAVQAQAVGETHDSRLEPLERLGVYRGFAWYEAKAAIPEGKEAAGVLVSKAGDVVSLYASGRYAGTFTPAGGTVYAPLENARAEPDRGGLPIRVRVEIWGHSNFDDIRLPGLRLHSKKGLESIIAVTGIRDITSNWRMSPAAEHSAGDAAAFQAEESWHPVVGFGGWLSDDPYPDEIYSKTLTTSADVNRWTLHFQNLRGKARLFVNGIDAGLIHPCDPFVDVTPHVAPGETMHLTVRLQRMMGQSAGRVILYEGVSAADYVIRAAEEPELLASAGTEAAQDLQEPIQLPIAMDPGAVGWLHGVVGNSAAGKGWRVHVAGTGLKLTVFLNETIVGRLWLPGGAGRPVMTGGSADSFYLPGPWLDRKEARLLIYLEAVDPQASGRLEALDFIPV